MTLEQHIEHLLNLLSPPFTENWRPYAWSRAKELAKDPELAELPSLLTYAMSSATKKSGTHAGKSSTGAS